MDKASEAISRVQGLEIRVHNLGCTVVALEGRIERLEAALAEVDRRRREDISILANR